MQILLFPERLLATKPHVTKKLSLECQTGALVITVILASGCCICFICHLPSESEHNSSLSFYPSDLETQAWYASFLPSFKALCLQSPGFSSSPDLLQLQGILDLTGQQAISSYRSLTAIKFGICIHLCWSMKGNYVFFFLFLNVIRCVFLKRKCKDQ